MKKLLSRMAEVLGNRNGCSAALAALGAMVFSIRNSSLGRTVIDPPDDWLQSYLISSPEGVISRSDFCVTGSLPSTLTCDLMMLAELCCWMVNVSVATRFWLTKTPKAPES